MYILLITEHNGDVLPENDMCTVERYVLLHATYVCGMWFCKLW